MSSNLQPPKNPNYAATVVALKDFVDLPNCDNVKAALIFGCSVIVSKDAQAGSVGLFFPVETALSAEFLGQNNLYRKPEWGNIDPEQEGFFEQHGRVKCMKFRGHKSEGFWIPMSSLFYLTGLPLVDIGTSFDAVGDHEICHKYIPRGQRKPNSGQQWGKQPRLEDSIVDGQFRFHPDTENLRRNIDKVSEHDWISISDKWHGTSVVIAKILVKRNLRWYERGLRKLGVQIMDSQYGLTYSSRRVIKAVNGVTKESNHFYTEDIWGIVAREVESKIPNGFTIYGEIVGFTPDGSPIQGGYAYGCPVGGHRLLVYRVTLTTLDGLVVELSWQQMTEFCAKYGFEMVKELYCGQAYALFFADDEFENEKFLRQLEGAYVRDQDCPYNPGMPAEGIVLRLDRLNEAEAFKLKNFRFLKRESDELDKGVLDTETAQAEPEEDDAPDQQA
jgi:hypothetical protein